MRLKIFLRSFVVLFFIFSVNSADISNQEEEKANFRFLQKVQGAANILAGATLFCDPIDSSQFIAAQALFMSTLDLANYPRC